VNISTVPPAEEIDTIDLPPLLDEPEVIPCPERMEKDAKRAEVYGDPFADPRPDRPRHHTMSRATTWYRDNKEIATITSAGIADIRARAFWSENSEPVHISELAPIMIVLLTEMAIAGLIGDDELHAVCEQLRAVEPTEM
jgi:hypothetical protein